MNEALTGWLSAILATLAFGSFAVPVKSPAADSVDIDPLVMQSYKSIMCFLTSWLVLLPPFATQFSFTPWGLVSGVFWVPAGAFNIFAIRNAGLAISQGIVSSSIVMVSFVWGNLIFRETVKSEMVAYCAVLLIMGGLYGMSYFSSGESKEESGTILSEEQEEKLDLIHKDSEEEAVSSSPLRKPPSKRPLELEPPTKQRRRKTTITILGATYSRRDIGLGSALMCGVWGGSCLVPMHYAPSNVKGLGYVISFSIGAITVTIAMWIIRYTFHLIRTRSITEAYECLPSFHLRVMWASGAAAGSLWSIGNVGSIVAVEYLGQGVGYSASQAALLVSGVWGIFYFKEVTNPTTIDKWFVSAILTIAGILLLGYESRVENST
jgi:glucose uptake protein GlcU